MLRGFPFLIRSFPLTADLEGSRPLCHCAGLGWAGPGAGGFGRAVCGVPNSPAPKELPDPRGFIVQQHRETFCKHQPHSAAWQREKAPEIILGLLLMQEGHQEGRCSASMTAPCQLPAPP